MVFFRNVYMWEDLEMKKTMKWLIPLLIGFALFCGISAYAETNGTDGNISWVLSDEGILTITGTGPINGSGQPWTQSAVKQVIIGDGISGIYSYAFTGCSNLQSIIVPDGLTAIAAEFAPSWCTIYARLDSDAAKALGKNGYSFRVPGACYSLRYNYSFDDVLSGLTLTKVDTNADSVTIPDGVTCIDFYAFYNCASMISVSIPDTVVQMGDYAFSGCSGLESIVIPGSISGVSPLAFNNCTSLAEVTIENGVRSIGGYTFKGCTGLQMITIPDSVISIIDTAFSGCSDVMIRSSWNAYARTWAESNNTPWVHDQHKPDVLAAVSPACEETGLTEGSVCSECGEVLIAQETVVALGHDLINHDSKAPTCTETGWTEYKTCSRCNYTTYTEISATGHHAVTDPAVTASCTETGLTEGKHCSVCNEVLVAQEVIPANGHTLIAHLENDMEVYWKCSVCDKIFSNAEGTTEFIGSGVYGDTIVWTLTDEGLLSIIGTGSIAFPFSEPPWGEIMIDNPDYIAGGGFGNPKQIRLPVTELIVYKGITGITNTGGLSGSVPLFTDKLKKVTLPDTFATVERYLFYESGIEAIDIPNSVTEVQEGAFYLCRSLESVVFTNSESAISNETFYGCTQLRNVVIPEGINIIGPDAFSGCTSLTTIIIPRSVNTIYKRAFNYDSNLESITFLGDIGKIDYWPYNEYGSSFPISEINNITITVPTCNSNVYSWAKEQETLYPRNTIITIVESHEETVTSEGKEPTFDEAGFTEGQFCELCGEVLSGHNEIPALKYLSVLYLPDHLGKIESEAFSNLTCQAIIISDGCTTIEEKAFAENDNLLYVHIPASVTTIADDAFEGCNNVVIFREE